jgi:hypothetical protein
VVRFAQVRLTGLHGCNGTQQCYRGAATGTLDGATRAALAAYQRAAKISADSRGALGTATLASLCIQGVAASGVQHGARNTEVHQLQLSLLWALYPLETPGDRQNLTGPATVAETNGFAGSGPLPTAGIGPYITGLVRDYQRHVLRVATNGAVTTGLLRDLLSGRVQR